MVANRVIRVNHPRTPAYLTNTGRGALFASTCTLRGINRVNRTTCAGDVSIAEDRLVRRTNTIIDALTDLGDVLYWTDRDIVAVHNTFHLAAGTCRGLVTKWSGTLNAASSGRVLGWNW